MTLEELQKIFPEATAEQLTLLSKGFESKPETPPAPTPPTPPSPKEVKADTQITMTAAELMQVFASFDKSKISDDKEKEKKFDDGIFI